MPLFSGAPRSRTPVDRRTPLRDPLEPNTMAMYEKGGANLGRFVAMRGWSLAALAEQRLKIYDLHRGDYVVESFADDKARGLVATA